MPSSTSCQPCSPNSVVCSRINRSFDGDVLVIGAGAAGMSAAHFLERAGVNVTVLEAGPAHGGRIKTVRDFVDFPIPLGGEWLHTDATELDALVDRTDHGITMAAYKPTDETGYWADGEYTLATEDPGSDLKFVGRTWLDVFDEFIVPSIADRMRFGVVVDTVDHSGDRIVVTAEDGTTFEADRVIVTAPIVALRDQMTFTPDLPDHMAYLADNADWQTPRRLSNPIDDRIFFAGSSYIKTIDGWGMVHLAARAGREAVNQILS